jgi:hypothetical protein
MIGKSVLHGRRAANHARLRGAVVLLAGPKVRGKRMRRQGPFAEHRSTAVTLPAGIAICTLIQLVIFTVR